MNIKIHLALVLSLLVSACSPIPVNPEVTMVPSNNWKSGLNNQISDMVVEVVSLQCKNSLKTNRWEFQNYKLLGHQNFIIHAISRELQSVDYIIKTNTGLPLVYFNIREVNTNAKLGCQYNLRLSTGQKFSEVINDTEQWKQNRSYFSIRDFFEFHDTVSVIAMPVQIENQYPRRTIEDQIIEEVASHIIQRFAITILCGLITGRDCHHY